MKELNLEFLELYKSVDRLIRDAYATGEGVTEYIRIMSSEYKGPKYVSGWADELSMLKHVRWVRNKLVHEVNYDADFCEESDYTWLKRFRENLISAQDPLSICKKQEEEVQRRVAEQRKRRQEENEDSLPKKRVSLWERIKRFFKGN